MIVNVIGKPGRLGGASVEVGDFVKMLVGHGVEVHMEDPTGGELDVAGCVCGESLPSAPVVSFGNQWFIRKLPAYSRLGPVVWVPCMNTMTVHEMHEFRRQPADVLVCHTDYQREAYVRSAVKVMFPRVEKIPGAFFPDDWKFAPLEYNGSEFCIGRIARADPMKWVSNYYKELSRLENIQAISVGVTSDISRRIGRCPPWAQEYKPDSVSVAEIYPRLHAMWAVGTIAENWSRVGLEAMATGVPIIANDKGGWREMLSDGLTGFLARDKHDAVDVISELMNDDEYRIDVANRARERVVGLSCDAEVWEPWKTLLESLC